MSNTPNSKPDPARRRHDDPLWVARRRATIFIWLVIGLPILFLVWDGGRELFFSATGLILFLAVVLIVFGVGVVEVLRKSLYKNEPIPKPPVDYALIPERPADPIDPDITYTLSSDGEIKEVMDEDKPPTRSFKLNDTDDKSL